MQLILATGICFAFAGCGGPPVEAAPRRAYCKVYRGLNTWPARGEIGFVVTVEGDSSRGFFINFGFRSEEDRRALDPRTAALRYRGRSYPLPYAGRTAREIFLPHYNFGPLPVSMLAELPREDRVELSLGVPGAETAVTRALVFEDVVLFQETIDDYVACMRRLREATRVQ